MNRDRTPRSLVEAFGPYAELTIEPDEYQPTLRGYLISILIAVFIVWISTEVSR